MRRELANRVRETGSLTNEAVVDLSQTLDEYILTLQNMLNEHKNKCN
ncbi:Spo0E family sporulation regulatory protein-aspartic acid phosphatase [Brevibacillus ruminantium]|uniref:Spo0E family sporulation regulatory protein-aspartic acid phosphatase n=2 Tax=Brevibacillus ruminantium TaxID=2950604 RepID=A0ABY4WN07_9BACL|nr:Spo0E family sporulation regulatory protein-aspartic acid phosphatase [Brevibacillus ruminantium]